MSETYIGIDVSTRKVAIAGLRRDGSITHHALDINPSARGAHRLRAARDAAWAVLDTYRAQTPIALIEIPRGPQARGSGFSLLACAAVVMEAAQAAIPGAVVMEVVTSKWKVESVGFGNATKEECMEHAKGLGYDGADQDVADALCMAQAAANRWAKHERGGA